MSECRGLAQVKPMSLVALKADEISRVRKWVEGPSPLNRAQGFMKSAFHQVAEGRPEPAAKLVISAAVLAGFGYKENPELASRIIETARRVVHHALAAKTKAAAGLGMWFVPTASKAKAMELAARLSVQGRRGLPALPTEREGQPGVLVPDISIVGMAPVKDILGRRGIPAAGEGLPDAEAKAAEFAMQMEWPSFREAAREAYSQAVERSRAAAVAGLTDLFSPYQLDSKGTMWALFGGLGMGPMELTLIQWMDEEKQKLLRSRRMGDETRAREHEKMMSWIAQEIRSIKEDEGGGRLFINPWTGEPA